MSATASASGELGALVAALEYKPGWSFKIAGPLNAYLCVFANTPDSCRPDTDRTTQHMFPIPQGVGGRALVRWVFECLLLAEQHECGEFFTVGGRRPFYPHHNDEGSPYERVERWELTAWA